MPSSSRQPGPCWISWATRTTTSTRASRCSSGEWDLPTGRRENQGWGWHCSVPPSSCLLQGPQEEAVCGADRPGGQEEGADGERALHQRLLQEQPVSCHGHCCLLGWVLQEQGWTHISGLHPLPGQQPGEGAQLDSHSTGSSEESPPVPLTPIPAMRSGNRSTRLTSGMRMRKGHAAGSSSEGSTGVGTVST